MKVRVSGIALLLGWLVSSLWTAPASAKDVTFRLERAGVSSPVFLTVQEVGEISARRLKDIMDEEKNFYTPASGYTLVPPFTVVNGYSIGKNNATSRQNCAGLALARLLRGPFLLSPDEAVRVLTKLGRELNRGETPGPSDVAIWWREGGARHCAVVAEVRAGVVVVFSKEGYERVYKGPADQFPAAKNMGSVKYYRLPWNAIRVTRLGGPKELSLLSATVTPQSGKPGDRFVLTIKYRLTGVRPSSAPGPSGETVMETVEVLGPQPLRLGTKPRLVSSPSAVDAAEVVATYQGRFSKPGNYHWRFVLAARGYKQTITKSVPFRVKAPAVTASEYRLARIEVTRSYHPKWMPEKALKAAPAGTRTHSAGDRSFALGWDFPWGGPAGKTNHNRCSAVVTLSGVPTTVTPGQAWRLWANMVGQWDTTGYGVDRDHTIRLDGAAGSGKWSHGGNPSGRYNGSFKTRNTWTVPPGRNGQVVLTLNAGLRFGGDHTGDMVIRLIYEGRRP
jgi:hypothetical protein